MYVDTSQILLRVKVKFQLLKNKFKCDITITLYEGKILRLFLSILF